MKVSLLVILIVTFASTLFGQNRGIPIASYFKDYSFFATPALTPVFPVSTGDVAVFKQLQDTQKRYSNFTYFLYQRELIEVHKAEGDLWITPILDIQMGKEFGDTSLKQQYNVRGARIEANLGKHVFVSSSFYENQAFLPFYVRQYVSNRGEFYPNTGDSSYAQVNAVIPNAARTKPFKNGGFDYAYATGYLRWDLKPWLHVSGGNQPLFIGSGYRSMIYSDNTAPTMTARVQLKLGKLVDFQVIRGQAMNLLRLPYAANGEALYERKGISSSSIYFSLGNKAKIGVVETAVWSRGDSLQKKAVGGAFYLPLPGAGFLQQALNEKANALIALDINYHLLNCLQVYGQYGTNYFKHATEAIQLGLRFWPFNKNQYCIQVEFNHTGKKAYQAANPRLNYSTYNLPLGHIMGYGVDELVLRLQGEYRKFFVNAFTNYYLNENLHSTFLLPIYNGNPYQSQHVFQQKIELGYRFNRSYAFEVFVGAQGRLVKSVQKSTAYWVNLGLRMNLNNHYFDF